MTRWLPTQTLSFALLGCAPHQAPEPAPQPVAPAAASSLAQVLEQVQREQKAFEAIHEQGQRTAKALGTLNGKLQSRGYFRRVPAQPALESLEGQLRSLAIKKLLVLQQFEPTLPKPMPPAVATVLGPGERWQPTLDQLRGVMHLRLDIGGRPDEIAAFVDALPSEVDRMVVVTGTAPLAGGTRLLAEAYYELPLPQPEVRLVWPTLAERLSAAGLVEADPKVAQHQLLAQLKTQVELGQNRLPDVRRLLVISADLARWLLRWQLFEERGRAEMEVSGKKLLGL